MIKNQTEFHTPQGQEGKYFYTYIARLGFFVFLYLFFSLLQTTNSHFINSDFNMYAYGALSFIFFNSAFVFLSWKKLHTNFLYKTYLSVTDVVTVFLFIQMSHYSPSQFVFIYLGVIIFAGLLLSLEQSLFVAALTCLLFNVNLIAFDPMTPALSYLMNNFSFVLTAYLSVSLSKHLSELSQKISVQSSEITEIKNLNSLIIENISSGIITTDNEDQILTFNHSAKDLFKSIDIGKNISDVLNINTKRVNDKGRYELSEDNNGEKRIIEAIQSSLFDDRGIKKGEIFLLQDLTKIKKLEYAARQQDKMAAVGQLAAGIAHEIRNPLASISGSVQLLESTSNDPENTKLFKIIIKEIDRLNNLITEFLEFVRPDKVNEEPVDLNVLVQEILNMVKFNKQLRQDVSLETNMISTRFIHADYPKLKQALLNIIINAYQAMDKAELAKLSISTHNEEDKVVLQISDTGNGIKPETLNKIFEPFHTTKAKGTGLGLAITHKILENHQAKVFVESKVGEGTKFTIEFPGKGDLKPEEARAVKIA